MHVLIAVVMMEGPGRRVCPADAHTNSPTNTQFSKYCVPGGDFVQASRLLRTVSTTGQRTASVCLESVQSHRGLNTVTAPPRALRLGNQRRPRSN